MSTLRPMKHLMRVRLVLLALVACAAVAAAAEPVVAGWRSEGYNLYPEAKPATKWSSKENVIWAAKTPEWSNATPLLVGDRIFITAEKDLLICVSAADGTIFWQKGTDFTDTVAPELVEKYRAAEAVLGQIEQCRRQLERKPGDRALLRSAGELYLKLADNPDSEKVLPLIKEGEPPQTHGTNGYTSASPVSDGRRVYVLFGTGIAAAFDPDGTRKWVQVVAKPRHAWGHSASPVLVDGKLILHTHDVVTALDPETGKQLWTARSPQAWGTPCAVRLGADAAIVTAGGDLIRTSDGRVIAPKIVTLPWSSAVFSNGIVYVADEKGARALKMPEKAEDSVKCDTVWEQKIQADRYYATPLLHDGLLYAVNQKGHLTVLEAAGGAKVYEKDLGLGATVYPSPVLAGPYVLASSERGNTVVFKAGREFVEVARNDLEGFRSTPIFAGDRMIVRGLRTLYCIGAKP